MRTARVLTVVGAWLLLALVLQFGGGFVSHAQSEQGGLSSLGPAEDVRSLLSSSFQQEDFLPVDQAFMLTPQAVSENSVNMVFEIAEGYYLYQDKIGFVTPDADLIESIQLPPPAKIKQDQYFGEVAIYDVGFSVPIRFRQSMAGVVLHASYQGCANDGICYAPVSQVFDLSGLADGLASGLQSANASDTGSKPQNRSMLKLLPAAFIAGLLLTFTPCVLPMIPVLSSILAGQGQSLTRARGGLIAVSYVLGTSVTWAAMGALAGATGDQLQAYFQNIWAIGLLSALLLVMAMSMFGVFALQMPAAVQERIQHRTGSLVGSVPLVFMLGLFSALIIGACVSPVLISVLGIAITTGSALLGAELMFAMAMGMGVPLIALGVGAGHLVPRAGAWMEKIRHGFGVMLVALAIYFLGTLPQIPVLLLWGGFFIILSVFAGATRRNDSLVSNWQRLEKGAGIILLVWGIILIAGGLMGQRDVFRPLPESLLGGSAVIAPADSDHADDNGFAFIRIADAAELQQQLSVAESNGRKVLIDYYADWCVDCVRMEESTFADPRVRQKLQADFVSLQIDVTDPQDKSKKQLKQKFGVFGPPATLFLDEKGQLLAEKGFYGYMDSEAFLRLLSEL